MWWNRLVLTIGKQQTVAPLKLARQHGPLTLTLRRAGPCDSYTWNYWSQHKRKKSEQSTGRSGPRWKIFSNSPAWSTFRSEIVLRTDVNKYLVIISIISKIFRPIFKHSSPGITGVSTKEKNLSRALGGLDQGGRVFQTGEFWLGYPEPGRQSGWTKKQTSETTCTVGSQGRRK